jgi:hypothetical protein
MTSLSILIPSRNEIFLRRTIEDILSNAEGDTNIIAILDGAWSDPPIPDDPRVTLVYHPVSVGQRAATNEAARLSTADFVMKCDAHCMFAKGFDLDMMAHCEPDMTLVPEMRNLHAFDWQCNACGDRTYQGPEPTTCKACGASEGFEMVVVWKPRPHTRQRHMRFDRDLHFQYWRGYKSRAGDSDLVETMSLIGACWMMRRARYWELGGLDELHGSWGQMGTEIACKTWLSGGRLLCLRTTWFAHLFRTQPGFKFPYPLSGSQVEQARRHSRWLWEGGNWEKAKYPLSWLVEKFAPVPGWEDVQPAPARKAKMGIVYYTCNTHDPAIEKACRRQLTAVRDGHALISVSREPIEFGDENIVVEGERGPLTMHKQILAGLDAIDADYVFLCENDVLYHESHFEFTPPRRTIFYYNVNVWKVWTADGLAVWTDDLQQVGGLCAARDLLRDFYWQRIAQIEQRGFDRHFEPGPKLGNWRTANWKSEHPNVDLRHGGNLTRSKRSPDEFRNQRYARGWTEAASVPGWGRTEDIIDGLH